MQKNIIKMKKWIIAFFVLAIGWGIGLFYGIRWRVNYLREANLFCSQNTALNVAAPTMTERIYSYGLDDYKAYEVLIPNYHNLEEELINSAVDRYLYYKAYRLTIGSRLLAGLFQIAKENSFYNYEESNRLSPDQWFFVPEEVLSEENLIKSWLDTKSDTIVLDSSYTDLVHYFEETKVLSKLYKDWAFFEEGLKSRAAKMDQDYEKLSRLTFLIKK
jgi:hypothetical protein